MTSDDDSTIRAAALNLTNALSGLVRAIDAMKMKALRPETSPRICPTSSSVWPPASTPPGAERGIAAVAGWFARAMSSVTSYGPEPRKRLSVVESLFSLRSFPTLRNDDDGRLAEESVQTRLMETGACPG